MDDYEKTIRAILDDPDFKEYKRKKLAFSEYLELLNEQLDTINESTYFKIDEKVELKRPILQKIIAMTDELLAHLLGFQERWKIKENL